MERKFYTNDFEQLLKENADQFKMTPSKKVWHGIYNDIHPGRRWPSIAISLLFISTLIFVGYLNIDQIQQTVAPGVPTDVPKSNNSLLAVKLLAKISPQNKPSSLNTNTELSHSHNIHLKRRLAGNPLQNIKLGPANTIVSQIYPLEKDIALAGNAAQPDERNDKRAIEININNAADQHILTAGETTPGFVSAIDGELLERRFISSYLPLSTSPHLLSATNNQEPEANNVDAKNRIQSKVNNGIENKPGRVSSFKKSHKNSRLNWAYYISPGITYRKYTRQGNVLEPMGNNLFNNTDLNSAVTHHISMGLEAGIAMKYSVSKNLNFTSGLQLNYSAYSIQANNIHPIIATLILLNDNTGMTYPFSSISYFGNGPGNIPVNLHNYSVQLGIPVGLEYQLAGNRNVQFFIAGTVQPTVVLAKKAYMLSTDKRNYLTDPSIARNWNMGTNLGTFVSVNSNKFKWQIGPQVHYQLLSSYNKAYQVREHYIDYSIRLAISRISR